MRNRLNRYIKPNITFRKVKLNFILTFWTRPYDSVDPFFGNNSEHASVLAYSCYCICSCVMSDAKVLMTDGTKKAIQDVRSGDKIVSYNLKTGKSVNNKVSRVLFYPNTEGGYIIINKKIKFSCDHRLWVSNESTWKRADALQKGDIILNSKQESIIVDRIEKIEGINDMYNLDMNDTEHNYFADNILVHNC